jgi:hypothetical protein
VTPGSDVLIKLQPNLYTITESAKVQIFVVTEQCTGSTDPHQFYAAAGARVAFYSAIQNEKLLKKPTFVSALQKNL